jgi:mediator of RNA polymerase II transcription subunit 7
MENEEVVNPFPSPPVHYLRYTKANLELLKTLRERSGTVVHETIPVADQQELLHDQPSLPEWDLTALERPRADWIVEEGGYEAFGDTWPVCIFHSRTEIDVIQRGA